MKNSRQKKILKLIADRPVETQDELARLLQEAGFHVTQATVSRDIKQMQLVKIVDAKSGRQRYASRKEIPKDFGGTYIRVFKEGVISMDLAMNILVVKTVSGMAMAVAAAMDAMDIDSIVGTIAGDDTIMCAIRTIEDAKDVLDRLDAVWKI
ncbi:MAG: arginine repressor [Lachnospiraceae bacterium]|nr:arginine repressor [Lachnospiraceae bacterium]